jgi:hypothetical protein
MTAKELGIANAEEAFDQKHEYKDNYTAIMSYLDNLDDTSKPGGSKEAARVAFYDRIELLFGQTVDEVYLRHARNGDLDL